MAQLLVEVPEAVILCEQYLEIYPGRNIIQLFVNDIYTNLLLALKEILRWYIQYAWSNSSYSLLGNNPYGEMINQSLHNIGRSKGLLIEESQLYLARSQRATLSTAPKIDVQSRETNSTTVGVGGRLAEFQEEFEETTKTHGKEMDALDAIKETLKPYGEGVGGLGVLKKTLDGAVRDARWNDDEFEQQHDEALRQVELRAARDKQRTAELAEPVARTAITPENLMKELNLKPAKHTHTSEVPMVLKHAQEGQSAFETTSPMSYLISALYLTLEQAPRTLVLPFFCGRSKASYGPKFMLRALLAQLLDLCNTHGYTGKGGVPILSFLGHEERAQLKEQDCVTYTRVLAQLLQELRKEYSAIFILIDGLDLYDSGFEEGMDDFVEGMKQLVKFCNKPDDKTPGGVLRVLLTTATSSRCFDSPAKPLVVIDVPNYIEGMLDGFPSGN
ncbi:uncharacterized protein J4E79_007722 [Alternaria viburni]|uniref:uncharacterized protein n=1 Tax=Alternaria viburni TaxID=566460 RepID=UPI0020C2E028|nr:uncharacterized protein J4E79_007722 [Alternaria viburni]KAI4657106.1 hypothetical protein J4E79_007722 [Alternaria viburni]